MAPLKALCTEKFHEWKEKFEKLQNLKVLEYTGDTDDDLQTNLNDLESAHIICTTPVNSK